MMQLFSAEKYFTRLNKKTQAIGFPYYKGGKMVSAKYRSIEEKDFTQENGGAQEFFGIDKIVSGLPITIVEGEIDALSLMECGMQNVLSVPSGAPMKVSDGKVDASEDKKFSYIWSAFEVLEKAPARLMPATFPETFAAYASVVLSCVVELNAVFAAPAVVAFAYITSKLTIFAS